MKPETKPIKKRKLRNREIEQKKRRNARLAATIFIAVAAVLVLGIVWVVWDTQSRSWIVRFEGERIHTNELRAFMPIAADADERQETLDFLIERLVLLDRAEAAGLALDEEDLEFWTWFITQEIGSSDFISDIRLAQLFTTIPDMGFVSVIWDGLAQHYIPDMLIFIDEDQFAIDLAEYKEANWNRYATIEVLLAIPETMEEAEEMRERVLSGEITFEELMREIMADIEDPEAVEDGDEPNCGCGEEVCINEGTEEELTTWNLLEVFTQAGLTPEDEEALLTLQAGEMSEIVNWVAMWDEEMPMIVYVVSREEPDEQEIHNALRTRRVDERRSELFLGLIPQWIDDADIRINQRALNRA